MKNDVVVEMNVEQSEEEQKKENAKAFEVYQDFLSATSFIDALDLRTQIERCINFEEGRQWNMDDDVEDFPKITVNIIKQIGKVRKSGILQNEYGFLVTHSKSDQVRKIQDFMKHLHNKMRLKKKDLKVVNDTYKKGTGICYFYWDSDSRDFLAKSGGKLKAETVDIRRFRVADPYIQEMQEQPYVILNTMERINSIKRKYGIEVTPDGEDFANKTEKPVNPEKVEEEFANVYTKFYRNWEGQVFFIITTQLNVLKEATPLNPFYKEGKKPVDSEEAPDTMSTMDDKEEKDEREPLEKEVFSLFPFASLVLDERDNSFYGIPYAYELIEAQKSINHHFSVYDKGLQDNVLGGWVSKQGVLEDQEIGTENGQHIELRMLPGEKIDDVFGRMPVNNIPNDTLNYSGSLMGVIKTTAGATNIQIGQSDHAGQSGKQTEALLQRARENSSDYALLFNEYKIDQAYIMFLFAKFYYDNESFAIVEHGSNEDVVRSYSGEGKKFNGNDYLDEDVLIDIKVGPAPSFSEYSSIEMLGMMVQSGQLPAEVYIASLPDGYINNRQELLKILKDNSQKQLQEMASKLEQSQQIMQQMSLAYKEVQKDKANIDVVIGENDRLKTLLAELSAKGIEISQKLGEDNFKANEQMKNLLNIIKRMGGANPQPNPQQ